MENKNADEILTSTSKFHITLGLDRIKQILEILGNPQDFYKIIHIAGTNGKGSTCKILNELLIKNLPDKKIGLFTSPHIFSYSERIKINNVDISKNIFDNLIFKINDLAQKNNIDLSEFELITAVAFYYFYIKKADYVVLEVGLGGLYDATNVVNPEVSVITTIDFDHTERLGSTIEKIASQKAGIIKQTRPVIILKDNLGFDIIKKEAKEKNAPLIAADAIKTEIKNTKNYAFIDGKEYEFNLKGSHQGQNLSLALEAAKIILEPKKIKIKNVLKDIKWDFRLEYKKDKNIVIDCAHNPSGIKTLVNFINESFKDENKIFIFGCLKNKDYKKMMGLLFDNIKNAKFYFFEFDYPSALKFDEMEEKDKMYFEDVIKYENKKEHFSKILNEKTLKIICGSMYMLKQILNDNKS